MNKAYIVDPNGDENYIIVKANHRPKGTVAIAPIEDGKPVTDIDWLDINEIDDGFGGKIKQAVVNETKKTNKQAQLQVELNARIAKRNDQASLNKHLNRMKFGMELKARVAVLNESKSWSQAIWNSYMNNLAMKNISGLLADGSLQTAKALIASTDLSEFYSSAEKQDIIDRITNYINQE